MQALRLDGQTFVIAHKFCVLVTKVCASHVLAPHGGEKGETPPSVSEPMPKFGSRTTACVRLLGFDATVRTSQLVSCTTHVNAAYSAPCTALRKRTGSIGASTEFRRDQHCWISVCPRTSAGPACLPASLRQGCYRPAAMLDESGIEDLVSRGQELAESEV